MTIVAGTDLSPAAHPVVDVAAAVARARAETLLLVHAADGPVLAHHRARLADEAERLRAAGTQVTAEVESGGVAEVLARTVRAAKIAEITLLVVGAQGRERRALLGTAATAALRRVAAPVLVVRSPERLAPLMDGARDGSRLRALVCVALDETERGVAEALRLLADTTAVDADVAHFHLIPEPALPAIQAIPATPGSAAKRHDLVRLASRDVVESLGPLPARVRTTPLVRDGYGRLDVHVGDLARERDVDIVVCGSHHRHGLDRLREGSVAEGVVKHAPVSVLVGRAP